MNKCKIVLCSILTIALSIFTFEFAKAQNVGIGTNTPNPSAKFEINSSNSGFLPPRMRFVERNAIVNPAQGLMIYCVDCGIHGGEPQYYNGTEWLNMIGGIPQVPPSAVSTPSVVIGTQVWSTKNLDVDHYRNGDPIPQVTDPNIWNNLTTGAWCWYNNDSATYGSIYGRLYNWYALNDPEGLAPVGWHVATDIDWNRMTDYLDVDVDTTCYCFSGTTIGTLMKSTAGWNSNGNGSNSSGFSGLPGGYRYSDGIFFSVGDEGNWWTASEYDIANAWDRNIYHYSTQISRYNASKRIGFYIRIVKDEIIVPSTANITTASITNLTSTSAISGGSITSDGGSTVTARGLCWSTFANPTISLSTKTTDGAGVGSFTSNITGLSPNTTYYVRAYATNRAGTSYGEQISFTTTIGTVVNLPSVTIGTQTWSSKNLDVQTYRNGDEIPYVTDPTQWKNLTTGAWCWYNYDSGYYGAIYGRLYNWYAVNDPRGLAPEGWHIATRSDWNKLVKYLDNDADTILYIAVQSTTAGGALKSTSYWNSPNTGANNTSGFSGLPGGILSNCQFGFGFCRILDYGYWWTASEYGGLDAFFRGLSSQNSSIGSNYQAKFYGLSVRVVKD